MPAEDGIRFECQPGCTACCDRDGQVHLTEDDVRNIAASVGMTTPGFEAKYVVRSTKILRLRKPRGKQCPFLAEGRCSVHPVKPVQCRLFPFWPELVENRREWKRTARWCPGIGEGPLIQIGPARAIAGEMRRAYPDQYER